MGNHRDTPAGEGSVPATVWAPQGSRLAQLAAEYAAAKPAADAAGARVREIGEAIKVELRDREPSATAIHLIGVGLAAPLVLRAKTSGRVDVKRLRTYEPATYVKWARSHTVWELRAVPPR